MVTFEESILVLTQKLTRSAWAYSDELISTELCMSLKNEIDILYQNDSLEKAKIGGLNCKSTDHQIRGDYIYWLEENMVSMDQLRIYDQITAIGASIKQKLFMNFERLECHFALYPPGSHYAKHLDKTRVQNTRFLTFVLFLNDKWELGHGGELSIFKEDNAETVEINIEPKMGRLVIFLSSNIYHEVLLTTHPRYSLTGWFNQAPHFERLDHTDGIVD